MDGHALTALSPLDGRYASKLEALAKLCSEAGLIRHRVQVEVAWFQALADCAEFTPLPPLSRDDRQFLDQLVTEFDVKDALAIKQIEATTNHDVKAVEYWLKDQLKARPSLSPYTEFIHFACTSEDINNVSWALIVQHAIQTVLDPLLASLEAALDDLVTISADQPMLSRTHGQTATPTTLGKEMANVIFRLRRQRRNLHRIDFTAKMNGAVGNYNAHMAAAPTVDWPRLSQSVIEKLGLVFNPYTTQIEPHDFIAEVAHCLQRVNTICLDFSRDMWGYISLGYFTQHLVEGEVGSSTMPHKINPIDFENAEGNLGLANAVLDHLASKLPISRFQRDLSDSTVQRSVGVALGYTALAWQSLILGLSKVKMDHKRIQDDLDEAWEVLAEAIQTVMRVHGIPEPYEKLKALTRGQTINQATVQAFIQTLNLPSEVTEQLMRLTPATYTGQAAALAKAILQHT